MTDEENGGPQHAEGTLASLNSPPDSIEIVKAVAEHEKINPLDLEFALGEHIDPDALEAVLDADVEDIEVSFQIQGVVVTVASDGTILVTDPN
jgi:hypothetical protein